ncbi:trihydrophobin-like [Coffea eugenioides]|uniref:trihydrophobin-like n=1 Tax=Coffea eugenioides TaxID=49369 RepID=UPI000F60F8A6|nr:trihydrophobin-like [Coffea eugenioides]
MGADNGGDGSGNGGRADGWFESRRRLYCNKAVNGGSTETSRVNGGVNESSGGCGAGGLGVNGSSCSGGSEAVGVKGSCSGAIHRVKAGAGGRGVVAMGELMGVGVIIVVMVTWVLIMGVMEMYRVIRTCSRRWLYCNKAVNGGSTETSRVNGGVNESSGGCGAGGLGVNGSSCSGSEAVGVKGSSSEAIHRVKAGAGGRGVVAMGS